MVYVYDRRGVFVEPLFVAKDRDDVDVLARAMWGSMPDWLHLSTVPMHSPPRRFGTAPRARGTDWRAKCGRVETELKESRDAVDRLKARIKDLEAMKKPILRAEAKRMINVAMGYIDKDE